MDYSHENYGEPLSPYKSPPMSPDVTTVSQDPMDRAEQRTTLTGKPIPERVHDHHISIMFSEGGGFGMGSAGANLLPPGYTDKSIVRIPIRESDLEAEQELEPESSDLYSPEVQVVKKGVFGGLFKGLKTKTTSSRQRRREGGFQMVMMTRKDYLDHWAKGEDGKFLPNVVEPPEGRRQWLKQQLKLNEQWVRDDPSLAAGKQKPDAYSKASSKAASSVGSSGLTL